MYSPKPHKKPRWRFRKDETFELSGSARAWLERYSPAERRTPAALRELGLEPGVSTEEKVVLLEAIYELTGCQQPPPPTSTLTA